MLVADVYMGGYDSPGVAGQCWIWGLCWKWDLLMDIGSAGPCTAVSRDPSFASEFAALLATLVWEDYASLIQSLHLAPYAVSGLISIEMMRVL